MNVSYKEGLPGVILSDFVSVKLSPPIPQELANDFLAMAIAKVECAENQSNDQEDEEARLKKSRIKVAQYGVSEKYIKQRYWVLAASDYGGENDAFQAIACHGELLKAAMSLPFFRDIVSQYKNPQNLDLRERMALYNKYASKSIRQMYDKEEAPPPDDIIHVTCSGYLMPSPVEQFVAEKQWLKTTVTHSYHMGCYGAIPALRIARGFLSAERNDGAAKKDRVDIVHTEILSIHSKIVKGTTEEIYTKTLFGDGFIKYSAFPEEKYPFAGKKGLKILAIKEQLVNNSLNCITWQLGSNSFDMTFELSVPYVIRDIVKPYVQEMFSEIGLDYEREKELGNIAFAIHPGSPVIIKKICEQLGLTEEDMALSNKVLYENGNMSSVTTPYILREIIQDDAIAVGKKVLNLAYGPGLTMAGMILEKV